MFEDFYTNQELHDADLSHDWVIEGFLPKGAISLFYGKQGTRKTFFLLSLVISLLRNSKFLGTWNTRPVNHILYIQADLPPVEQQERVQRAAKLFPWLLKDERFTWYMPPYFDINSIHDDHELVKFSRGKEIDLVIWDVLRKIHHMKEESHYPGVVYEQMKHLFPYSAQKIGHHERKDSKDSSNLDPAESFSGPGGLLDLAVSGWRLEEVTKDKRWKLTTTKNNCGPKPRPQQLSVHGASQLLYTYMGPVQETIEEWRVANDCNPRKLNRREKRELTDYLLSCFVGNPDSIKAVVEGL